MKHSNVFYRRTKDGYEPVKDAKAIRNRLGFDLYRIGYNIFEGKTGLQALSHNSKEEIQGTLQKLETDTEFRSKLENAIEDNIKKTGLSPRYERPDEKYDDLFPREPAKKAVIAPTLDGQKHYFVEAYNENNIVLYMMKTEKTHPHARLFLFYEGWMLGMDNAYNKDRIIEELSKGLPDYRQIMTDSLNNALTDPDKWANKGFANFLGRTDEADTHNQVIRDKREAVSAAEQQERERLEEIERKAEQDAYETAIFEAEQAILGKRPVINNEVRDTSLFLHLFRKYDIVVPLKTQGWIKSSLHSVYYGENYHDWSFRYFGNLSNSFGGCFNQLVGAIEREYDNLLDQALPEMSEDDELEP